MFEEKGVFLLLIVVIVLVFFVMVGFEDLVNMVEEVKDFVCVFFCVMLVGLGIIGVIYVLVVICVVVLVLVG